MYCRVCCFVVPLWCIEFLFYSVSDVSVNILVSVVACVLLCGVVVGLVGVFVCCVCLFSIECRAFSVMCFVFGVVVMFV